MTSRSQGRLNPTIAHVRSLDGEFYLCTEVADALGISPATLRRRAARDPDRLRPSRVTRFGATTLALYDLDDVNRLAADVQLTVAGSRRGRPRLWDDHERRTRRRAHSAASYQRRRARTLTARGDTSSAAAASELAHATATSLAEQRQRRQAQSSPARIHFTEGN